MQSSEKGIIAGRYRVEEFLGRGGMAEVYRVWDEERATTLALKMLRKDLARDVVFLRRFKREGQNLAQLQHPNIVRFYGLEQDGLQAFMLMDYVEGEDLQTEIYLHRERGIPPGRTQRIIRPICSALAYAHKQGLVHCDIKPGNILLENSGRVQLTDFGIARLTDAATATMVGAGTPAYMAPEQAKGLDPVPQTDIYALGVVLFEMLTGGERPFTGERAESGGTMSAKVRWEQVNLAPPDPRENNPEIGEQLAGVVLRCLEKEPRDRYLTPLELMRDLERVIGPVVKDDQPLSFAAVEQKSEAPTEIAPEQEGGGWGWKVWLGVGLGVFLMGLLTLGWVLGWGPFGGEEPEETQMVQVTVTAEGGAAVADAGESPEPPATDTVVVTETPAPTSTPEEQYQVGDYKVSDVDGMKMMYIPAGEFLMGTTAEGQKKAVEECVRDWGEYNRKECETRYADEDPRHLVYLDGFWMDRVEISHQMYVQFLRDVNYQENNSVPYFMNTLEWETYLSNPGGGWYVPPGMENKPVVGVTWYGAQAYCEWAGRRLPTEAEWEKAARGEEGRTYPWGDTFDNNEVCSNLCDEYCPISDRIEGYADALGGLGDVGRCSEMFSPYGIINMAGNVSEWVSDWYGADYYQDSPSSNPVGAAFGGKKVIKGGSYKTGLLSDVRSAFRGAGTPDISSENLGFRCAADANSE